MRILYIGIILALGASSKPAVSTLKGERVLVIGGTQFIGRHTVQSLLDAEVAVEILHSGASRNPWRNDEVPETICNRERPCLGEKLQKGPWFMVVDFPLYNMKYAHAILEHAALIHHYVFISTDDVYMVCDRKQFQYGTSGKLLEESAVRPSDSSARRKLNKGDMYGHDKKKIEEHLEASQLNFTSLRLPDVWGPFENTGRFNSFLQELADGKPIGLEVSGVVGAGRSFKPGFVFARDVAQMVLLLMRHGPQQQSLNVAVHGEPTIKELVEESHSLLKQHLVDVAPLIFSDALESPLLSVDVGPLDISKAVALGFAPTPWKEGWHEAVSHAIARQVIDAGNRAEL